MKDDKGCREIPGYQNTSIPYLSPTRHHRRKSSCLYWKSGERSDSGSPSASIQHVKGGDSTTRTLISGGNDRDSINGKTVSVMGGRVGRIWKVFSHRSMLDFVVSNSTCAKRCFRVCKNVRCNIIIRICVHVQTGGSNNQPMRPHKRV